MNKRAILRLALFGVAMGVASVMGWTGAAEPWLWIGIAIICAGVLAHLAPDRFFLHGFLTGLLAGGIAPLLQSAFFPLYLQNNPEVAAQLAANAPRAISARTFFAVTALPIGTAYGLVVGFLTWVAAKVFRRRATVEEGRGS